MVRIIHINDKVESAGGVEVYLSQLQSLLNREGCDSKWVAIRREGQYVSIVDASQPELKIREKLSNLRQALVTDHPDQAVIYHVHSLSDPVLLQALFAIGRVVRTMHEPRLFCPGQGKFWRTDETICSLSCGLHCAWHAYQKKCCNRHPKRLLAALRNTHYELTQASEQYAAIIANSHWTATEAIAAGLPEHKIRVIPYFTNPAEPVPITPEAQRSILFVGRLTKEKGLHYLFDALSKIYKGETYLPGKKPRLEIVGDGHERSVFENLAVKLGFQDSCTFHGWLDREQVKEQFQRCYVVVFPSIYPEAFGITGIEAMMQGRPVVAFDAGGVREWLNDGVSGRLVPLKDSNRLAVALAQLCNDSKEASRLGNGGHSIALKRFLPQMHLSTLINLYRQINS